MAITFAKRPLQWLIPTTLRSFFSFNIRTYSRSFPLRTSNLVSIFEKKSSFSTQREKRRKQKFIDQEPVISQTETIEYFNESKETSKHRIEEHHFRSEITWKDLYKDFLSIQSFLIAISPNEEIIQRVTDIVPSNWIVHLEGNILTIRRTEEAITYHARSPCPWALYEEVKAGKAGWKEIIEMSLVFSSKLSIEEYDQLEAKVKQTTADLNAKMANIERDPFRPLSRANEWLVKDDHEKDLVRLVWKHKNSIEVMLNEQRAELANRYSVVLINNSYFREAFFPDEVDREIYQVRENVAKLLTNYDVVSSHRHVVTNAAELEMLKEAEHRALSLGCDPLRISVDPEEERFNKRMQIPYQVAFGKRAGAVKCRGCKRSIVDKEELRIRVDGMFTPPNSGPYPGKNSFCLNAGCVQAAIRKDSKDHTVYYPAWDGKLGVTAELKEMLGGELPVLDGIEWVVI